MHYLSHISLEEIVNVYILNIEIRKKASKNKNFKIYANRKCTMNQINFKKLKPKRFEKL